MAGERPGQVASGGAGEWGPSAYFSTQLASAPVETNEAREQRRRRRRRKKRERGRERDEGSARPHGWAGIRPSPSYLQTFFIFLPLLFFFLVFFPCNSFARSRIIFFQIVAAHTGIPVYLFNPHDKHAHFLIFRGFVSKNIFTERIWGWLGTPTVQCLWLT